MGNNREKSNIDIAIIFSSTVVWLKILKKSYDYLSRVERDNSNIKHEIDDTKVLTDEVVRAKVQQESNKNIEVHLDQIIPQLLYERSHNYVGHLRLV